MSAVYVRVDTDNINFKILFLLNINFKIIYKLLSTASFISVSEQHQPDKEDIANGFSLSAWVQPFENTDGYILAKTNPDGSRHFYSLRIITTSIGTQLTLGYSASGSNVRNFLLFSAEKNISTS